jgi:hypothetical protein
MYFHLNFPQTQLEGLTMSTLTPPHVTGSLCKMASALEWVPDSLYNTAISTVVTHYSSNRKELRTLPENVQFDIYYKVLHRRSSFPVCAHNVFVLIENI